MTTPMAQPALVAASDFLSQSWVFHVGSPPPTSVRRKDRQRDRQKRRRQAPLCTVAMPVFAPASIATLFPAQAAPPASAPPPPAGTVSMELPVELVQSTVELALMQPLSQAQLIRGCWLRSLLASDAPAHPGFLCAMSGSFKNPEKTWHDFAPKIVDAHAP